MVDSSLGGHVGWFNSEILISAEQDLIWGVVKTAGCLTFWLALIVSLYFVKLCNDNKYICEMLNPTMSDQNKAQSKTKQTKKPATSEDKTKKREDRKSRDGQVKGQNSVLINTYSM